MLYRIYHKVSSLFLKCTCCCENQGHYACKATDCSASKYQLYPGTNISPSNVCTSDIQVTKLFVSKQRSSLKYLYGGQQLGSMELFLILIFVNFTLFFSGPYTCPS